MTQKLTRLVTLRFSEEEWTQISLAAAKQGRTVSGHIRTSLFVRHEPKESDDSVRHEQSVRQTWQSRHPEQAARDRLLAGLRKR